MISEFFDFIRGDISALEFVLQLGAICFVVFCATPIHEYAHALIATKLGDDTPRSMGRLTIDPKAHIDPIGAINDSSLWFWLCKACSGKNEEF